MLLSRAKRLSPAPVFFLRLRLHATDLLTQLLLSSRLSDRVVKEYLSFVVVVDYDDNIMSAEEDTELRDLVAQTLEANGVLGKIRVNLTSVTCYCNNGNLPDNLPDWLSPGNWLGPEGHADLKKSCR